jgi:membrane protein
MNAQQTASEAIDGIDQVADLPWQEVVKRAWKQCNEDNVSLVASGVAFNAFFGFVPFLTSVILTYGLVAAPRRAAQHIGALAGLLPENAAHVVGAELQHVAGSAARTTGLGLVVTLGLALYGALRGARGIISGLNMAYNVKDSRSFPRRLATAAAITVGMIVAFLFGSIGVSMVGFLSAVLPDIGGVVDAAIQIGFWLVAAAAVITVIALIYRYAPNVEDVEWRWATAGSLVATIIWLLATFGFGVYVRNFSNFRAIYGALGAVMVFMTWLYVSAYILIAGAELNQVLEQLDGDGEAPDRD